MLPAFGATVDEIAKGSLLESLNFKDSRNLEIIWFSILEGWVSKFEYPRTTSRRLFRVQGCTQRYPKPCLPGLHSLLRGLGHRSLPLPGVPWPGPGDSHPPHPILLVCKCLERARLLRSAFAEVIYDMKCVASVSNISTNQDLRKPKVFLITGIAVFHGF